MTKHYTRYSQNYIIYTYDGHTKIKINTVGTVRTQNDNTVVQTRSYRIVQSNVRSNEIRPSMVRHRRTL